jgi:hypothetical protein
MARGLPEAIVLRVVVGEALFELGKSPRILSQIAGEAEIWNCF